MKTNPKNALAQHRPMASASPPHPPRVAQEEAEMLRDVGGTAPKREYARPKRG